MTRYTGKNIDQWADKTIEQMDRIVRTATQDMFEEMMTPQPSVKDTGGAFEFGKIPVDWGDLIGSFVVELNGARMGGGQTAYVAALAGTKAGDQIFGGWTAEYAPAIEFGTEQFAGRYFMGANLPKWPDIVREAVRKEVGL